MASTDFLRCCFRRSVVADVLATGLPLPTPPFSTLPVDDREVALDATPLPALLPAARRSTLRFARGSFSAFLGRCPDFVAPALAGRDFLANSTDDRPASLCRRGLGDRRCWPDLCSIAFGLVLGGVLRFDWLCPFDLFAVCAERASPGKGISTGWLHFGHSTVSPDSSPDTMIFSPHSTYFPTVASKLETFSH